MNNHQYSICAVWVRSIALYINICYQWKYNVNWVQYLTHVIVFLCDGTIWPILESHISQNLCFHMMPKDRHIPFLLPVCSQKLTHPSPKAQWPTQLNQTLDHSTTKHSHMLTISKAAQRIQACKIQKHVFFIYHSIFFFFFCNLFAKTKCAPQNILTYSCGMCAALNWIAR